MRRFFLLIVIFLAIPGWQAHAQTVVEFEDFTSDIARYYLYAELPNEPPTASNQGINSSGGVELVGRHALTFLEPKSFLVGEMVTVSAFVRTGDFLSVPETGIRLGQLYLTNASNGHAFQYSGISTFYAAASFDGEGIAGIGGVDASGITYVDFAFPPFPEFLPHRWYELSATFTRNQNPKVNVSFTVTDYGVTGETSLGVLANRQRTFNSHTFELWNQPWYVGFATDDLSGMIVDRFSVHTGLVGDFDLDGDVDGRDFLTWQRNPSVGNLEDWQANYGASSLSASTAVPEPASIGLLLSLLCCLIPRRL
jgi:hypothetical protein